MGLEGFRVLGISGFGVYGLEMSKKLGDLVEVSRDM